MAALMAATTQARAQASADCQAVLIRPQSDELLERIAGQSQDAPCALSVVAAAPEQGCAELAALHRATAVLRVRVAADGTTYEVVVCDAEAGYAEQTRRVALEAKPEALTTSATYEAVALVVRSALVDLDSEQRARREQTDAEALALAREQQAREQQAREARDEDNDRAADDPSTAPRFHALVGAHGVLLGADAPALALSARLAVDLGPVRLAVSGAYGLSAELRDASARLLLARHSGLLHAGLPIALGAGYVLEPSLHAGLAAFSRRTRARVDGVTPTADDTSVSALLGAELALQVPLLGPLGLRIELGLDVAPAAPEHRYLDVSEAGSANDSTPLASPSYVQPRAGLSVALSL